MEHKPKTKSEGLRLPLDHWVRLRALMQARGRIWLEKIIDREFSKLGGRK